MKPPELDAAIFKGHMQAIVDVGDC